MKFKVLPIFMLALISLTTGCTVLVAPEQQYELSPGGEAIAIGAEYTDGLWRDGITVFIDGEEIISGPLTAYEDKGEYRTELRGMDIRTNCYPRTHFRLVTECIVYVNEQQGALFLFKVKE